MNYKKKYFIELETTFNILNTYISIQKQKKKKKYMLYNWYLQDSISTNLHENSQLTGASISNSYK